MITKGPAVPTAAATAVLGLVIGAVAGFYGRASQETGSGMPPGANSGMGGSAGRGGAGGGMGGGGGRGGGGGGFGGGAQQPNPGRDLATEVGNLRTLEKVQNKGLTAKQKTEVLAVVAKIKPDDKLSDDDSKALITNINGVLTDDQKDALKALQPQRGGGGGGRGGAGGGGGRPGGAGVLPPPPGAMGAAPPSPMGAGGGGGMGASGGMGGGGARPDPNKPFAGERSKQALEELIGELKK